MSDRIFATSFDKIAEEYDRYRSGYPADLVRDIFSVSNLSPDEAVACEIGCGTGQATTDVSKLGASITCVEPGSELLRRAQKNLSGNKNISFINSTFEDAPLTDNTFDLVYAAQSFHWIDKSVGYRKVSKILKSRGCFAAFWKFGIPSEGKLHLQLEDVYERFLSSYTRTSATKYELEIGEDFESFVKSELFTRCQLRRYPLPVRKTDSQTFCNELSTWSKIAVLPEDRKEAIFLQIRNLIDSSGGYIDSRESEAILITGLKP